MAAVERGDQSISDLAARAARSWSAMAPSVDLAGNLAFERFLAFVSNANRLSA